MKASDQKQTNQKPRMLNSACKKQKSKNISLIFQEEMSEVSQISNKKGSIIPVYKSTILKSQAFKSEKDKIDTISYLYFQKQSPISSQCLKHAINNLFGLCIFTSNQMVDLCKQLSPQFINPHKHIFGGDYDANVMMLAMQKIGRKVVWFDKRNFFQFTQEQETEIQGYLINIKIQSGIFKRLAGLSGRHWISMKWIREKYFVQYDSKKSGMQIITDKEAAVEKINNYLSNQGQLFKVYRSKQQLEKIKLIEDQQKDNRYQEQLNHEQ